MRRSVLIAAFLFSAALTYAAPCVTTESACTEWITLGGGPSRSLIYRTYSLDTRNESITRALIMVHGARREATPNASQLRELTRDADNYFRTAVAAAFLRGALEDTVVVSPRFAANAGPACRDTLAPNEVNWNCSSWRSGGPATDNGNVTSFDFTDEILRKLARKDIFPNLRAIVVAGHSAGGQYVTRYEMANQVHYKLGVAVTYVVANPSSYAYPDAFRPTDAAYSVSARAPSYVPAPADHAATKTDSFRPFGDARNCTTYDLWPYGFRNRTGYTQKLTDDELKKELVSRPTTFLLGELDVLPLGGFDGSCTAMAQGPTRLARGEAFSKYVNERLGGHQSVTIIPLCGHNARCMFTAEPALPVIFPKQ